MAALWLLVLLVVMGWAGQTPACSTAYLLTAACKIKKGGGGEEVVGFYYHAPIFFSLFLGSPFLFLSLCPCPPAM